MDGRRARSVSSHSMRGERREKDRDITVPLQQENPFTGNMNIPISSGDIGWISPI
jgi:hypothetical protein